MSPRWRPPAPAGQARQLADGSALRHGTRVLAFVERRWRPATVDLGALSRGENRRSVPVRWQQDNGADASALLHVEWVAATAETRTRGSADLVYLDRQPPAPDSAT